MFLPPARVANFGRSQAKFGRSQRTTTTNRIRYTRGPKRCMDSPTCVLHFNVAVRLPTISVKRRCFGRKPMMSSRRRQSKLSNTASTKVCLSGQPMTRGGCFDQGVCPPQAHPRAPHPPTNKAAQRATYKEHRAKRTHGTTRSPPRFTPLAAMPASKAIPCAWALGKHLPNEPNWRQPFAVAQWGCTEANPRQADIQSADFGRKQGRPQCPVAGATRAQRQPGAEGPMRRQETSASLRAPQCKYEHIHALARAEGGHAEFLTEAPTWAGRAAS